jgi:hypothetical protein
MYWRALQVGEPVLLDRAEMVRVIEKFKTYGQQPGRRRTSAVNARKTQMNTDRHR